MTAIAGASLTPAGGAGAALRSPGVAGANAAAAVESTSASAGRRQSSRGNGSLRLRKLPRRRPGHVPAWLLAAGALAAPVPGSAPSGGPAPPAPVDPAAPAPPAPAPPAPAPTCGRAVGAREGEWFVTLSRASACSGQITIEAQNYGSDPHDLRLQHENGPEVASWPTLAPGSPGGVLAKKVTLTPGRYTLYCALVGGTPAGTPGESHAAAGMTSTLTIVAP